MGKFFIKMAVLIVAAGLVLAACANPSGGGGNTGGNNTDGNNTGGNGDNTGNGPEMEEVFNGTPASEGATKPLSADALLAFADIDGISNLSDLTAAGGELRVNDTRVTAGSTTIQPDDTVKVLMPKENGGNTGGNDNGGNNTGGNNTGNNDSNEGDDEIIDFKDADRTITLTTGPSSLVVTISHGEWKDDSLSSSTAILSMLADICNISATGDIDASTTPSGGIRYYTKDIDENNKNVLSIALLSVGGKDGTISFTLKDSGTRGNLLNETTGFVGYSSVANWTAKGTKGPYIFHDHNLPQGGL
jgi:hypothetical protein